MQHFVQAELSVAETLQRWPQTIPVFLRHRMACVGCAVASFETLAEATAIYGLSTERFVDELREAVQPLIGKRVNTIKRVYIMDQMEKSSMDEKTAVTVTIDVRQVPPPQRHPMIFETFESLEAGEGFVLVNDHDPKPLYYQFRFEREGQFIWDYLEQGPTVWRVRIGRPLS